MFFAIPFLIKLSSGDDAHLMVWRLETGERLQDIDLAFHGSISTICWVEFDDVGPNRAFIFGCVDGTLHVYRKLDNSMSSFCLSRAMPHQSSS